jgi:RimJ/RimL family protein N-acetyltransferase
MVDADQKIETSRLLLRVHVAGDLDESATMWGDPEVTRHISGRPFTREESWARLVRYVGHWKVLGYGSFAVHERASGRFVGEVGLADFKREIVPPFGGVPEMGWALATWAQGQGFASEAVKGVLDWADARGLRETVCIVEPANTASLAVAARCGYVRVREVAYKDKLVIVHRRLQRP